MKRDKRIAEARKAVEGLEAAIDRMEQVARETIRALPETTVMMKQYASYAWSVGRERFSCANCNAECENSDWKFCAFCGYEIIRFQRDPQKEMELGEKKIVISCKEETAPQKKVAVDILYKDQTGK